MTAATDKPTRPRIILGADEIDLDTTFRLIDLFGEDLYALKAHILLDQHGPEIIYKIKQRGVRKFWGDFKFKDTLNTVAHRCRVWKEHGADIVSVHASGEIEMMMAAVENGPEIYAITVLTSLGDEQAELDYGKSPGAGALYFARLAKLAGVHGVVCSATEVGMLRKRPELKGMRLTVPGTRPDGQVGGGQQRVGTAEAAIKDGADEIVIARQLSNAKDPLAEFRKIQAQIAAALAA